MEIFCSNSDEEYYDEEYKSSVFCSGLVQLL